MRQLFPNFRDELSQDGIYTLPELDFATEGIQLDDTTRRPYIYFNMVSSVDGKAVTAKGDAGGLGSSLDHHLMHRLRAASDAVLVGAETFRRDPFVPIIKPALAQERAQAFPDAPQPWGVVLSRDGNLPLDKKFFQVVLPQRRLIALGQSASAEAQARLASVAQVVRVPDRADKPGWPDLGWLLDYLHRELGVRKMLCEGGPGLNFSLLEAGFGDELFWTLAPRLVAGSEKTTILSGPPGGFAPELLPRLQLRSLYEQNSELFFRYIINTKPTGSNSTSA